MATPAEIQAEIDPAGTGLVANIQQVLHVDDTYDNVYAVGVNSYPGRSRWVKTTRSDNAATQATAILAALAA